MTPRLNQITEQRLEKLKNLAEQGVNPYPNRYQRSHTTKQAIAMLEAAEADPDNAGIEDVSIAGRVMAKRKMGKITFIDLRDDSGKIQLFCHKDQLNEASVNLLKELDIGDVIGAQGKPFRTKTNEPTVETRVITLLSKSLQPLPEKWHGLNDVDTRFRQRYLDLISNNEVKESFKIRSQIIQGVRRFLDRRGFMEVETPMLQPSAGGALATPFITHHESLDRDLYLRIALELYLKRLIIGGFEKVYELGRCFRNEGLSTRHNPEFTMMESYEAYADYNDVMNMVEEMVSEVCYGILGGYEVKYGDDTISFKPPWPRLDLRQALIDNAGIDFEEFPDAGSLGARMREMGMNADPTKDRGRLIDQLLSDYVEPKLIQPSFLVDYPIDMSPLAKTKPDNDRIVERFEAFAGGIEIANAFSELNDPQEQRKRFNEQLKNRAGGDSEQWTVDEDFLAAMEYGMPPTGGLGVGIDRLVMLLTGQQAIREVIFFPQLKEK